MSKLLYIYSFIPLVCPPPPSDLHNYTDEMIGKLIAPRPASSGLNNSVSPSFNLLKDTNLNNNNGNINEFPGQSQDLSSSRWADFNQASFSDCRNSAGGTAEIQQLLKDNQQSSLDYDRGRLHANLPVDAFLLGTGSLDQVEPLPADDEPSTNDLERNGLQPISDTERLKKAIRELVDTERSYVNVS